MAWQEQREREPLGTSPYLQEILLQEVFRDAVYLSLHYANPGDSGMNQVSGGGYEQQLLDFAVVDDPSPEAQSTRLVQFSNMPNVTLTHLGLWDVSGNFLQAGEIVDEDGFPVAKRVLAGDRVEFAIGDLLAMFET